MRSFNLSALVGLFTMMIVTVTADPYVHLPGSGGSRRKLHQLNGLGPLPKRRMLRLSQCNTNLDCVQDADCVEGRCVGGPDPPMFPEPTASPPASAPVKSPYVAPPLKTGRKLDVGDTCLIGLEGQCDGDQICAEVNGSADPALCVECVVDSDCPAGTSCFGIGYCWECVEDSDCDVGQFCFLETYTCTGTDNPTESPTFFASSSSDTPPPTIRAACSEDSDCPAEPGMHCSECDGLCYDDVCSDASDCPCGEACVEGMCAHDDTDHTHAPEDDECPAWLEDDGACDAVDCLVDDNGWCQDGQCETTRPCTCVSIHCVDNNGGPIPQALVDLAPLYATFEECMCAECDQCNRMAGANGDPHIFSMAGKTFDYHGECDLKLMHAPNFDQKQTLDIHVRTTIRYDYSFIEAAAIKIGKDVLEVASWGSYALNGVEDALGPNRHSVPTVGGYPVYHIAVDENKHTFDIVISDGHNVSISTYKDWVGVKTFEKNTDKSMFESVSGLVGNFEGELLGRDGTNLEHDIIAFGQDWQIQPEEEMLFRTAREPQAPQLCRLPSQTTKLQRRLGGAIPKDDAEKACARFTGAAASFCVHDVMASGDLDMAQSDFFDGYGTF